MKCPACGMAELAYGVRDIPYTRRGETVIIPAVSGEHCPRCGEAVLNAAESMRVSRWMARGSGEARAHSDPRSHPNLHAPTHAGYP